MDQVAEKDQQQLDTVSAALVQEDIIKHENADVRLLVACCLTDIIRIYVPNAPYDDNQLEVRVLPVHITFYVTFSSGRLFLRCSSANCVAWITPLTNPLPCGITFLKILNRLKHSTFSSISTMTSYLCSCSKLFSRA